MAASKPGDRRLADAQHQRMLERLKDPRCRHCDTPLTEANWAKYASRVYHGYSCKACESNLVGKYKKTSEWGWLHTLISNVNARGCGTVTTEEMRQKYSGECHWCGVRLTEVKGLGRAFGGSGRTIDHVIPVTRGGLSEAANLVFSCWPCNLMKGNMLPEEFLNRMKAILTHMAVEV